MADPARQAGAGAKPEPGDRPPLVVYIMVVLLLAQACATWNELRRLLDLLSHRPADGWDLAAFGWLGYTMLASLLLTLPFAAGRRWAWSAVLGCLLVRTAAGTALTGLGSTVGTGTPYRPHVESALAVAIPLALVSCALCAALFRAHPWFGVPQREGWRTLRREGRWALLLGAGFDLGPLLWLISRPTGF